MAYTQAIPESTTLAASAVESIPLRSSFLAAASYDPANYAMTLSFKNGYSSVHRFIFPSVWAAFKIADSHGSFYANTIKKQYPGIPVNKKLLVSDLTKAKKEFGSHAAKH